MSNKISSVTVGLPVTDLSRATDWYRLLLGSLEEVSPMEGIWEIRVTSSFWLQLFELEAEESSSKSVNFETDDIERSHELVLSLGVDAGQIETVPEAIQYFEFSDPFGNLLSFYKTLGNNA
ncbi:VOC family protein [Aliamphritea ceti]|uniref:VOC family protein n=1 Tax=Aliamphritea ceti TaxID=1524258 RepID=UPI0021C3B76D|nr:VOC family protein [Aliamphritea ceti]